MIVFGVSGTVFVILIVCGLLAHAHDGLARILRSVMHTLRACSN